MLSSTSKAKRVGLWVAFIILTGCLFTSEIGSWGIPRQERCTSSARREKRRVHFTLLSEWECRCALKSSISKLKPKSLSTDDRSNASAPRRYAANQMTLLESVAFLRKVKVLPQQSACHHENCLQVIRRSARAPLELLILRARTFRPRHPRGTQMRQVLRA